MRILLDTNIGLDVLLNREPWVGDAQRLWRVNDEGRVAGYEAALNSSMNHCANLLSMA